MVHRLCLKVKRSKQNDCSFGRLWRNDFLAYGKQWRTVQFQNNISRIQRVLPCNHIVQHCATFCILQIKENEKEKWKKNVIGIKQPKFGQLEFSTTIRLITVCDVARYTCQRLSFHSISQFLTINIGVNTNNVLHIKSSDVRCVSCAFDSGHFLWLVLYFIYFVRPVFVDLERREVNTHILVESVNTPI